MAFNGIRLKLRKKVIEGYNIYNRCLYQKETHCIATFIPNKLKCYVFLFSLFSSKKLENWRAEQVHPGKDN
jgi:hypothetical protein